MLMSFQADKGIGSRKGGGGGGGGGGGRELHKSDSIY